MRFETALCLVVLAITQLLTALLGREQSRAIGRLRLEVTQLRSRVALETTTRMAADVWLATMATAPEKEK